MIAGTHSEMDTSLLDFYNEIFKKIFNDKYRAFGEENAPRKDEEKIGDLLINMDYVGDENQRLDDKSMQFILDNLVYRNFEVYDNDANIIYFEEYDYETNTTIKMRFDINYQNDISDNKIQYLYIDPSYNELWKDIEELIKDKTKNLNNILPPKYIKMKQTKLKEHYTTVNETVSNRQKYLDNILKNSK